MVNKFLQHNSSKIILLIFLIIFFESVSAQNLPDPITGQVSTTRNYGSDFGPRNTITNGATYFHAGLDYPLSLNSFAYTVEAGTITEFSYDPSGDGYAANIKVNSGGKTWRYVHMLLGVTNNNRWEIDQTLNLLYIRDGQSPLHTLHIYSPSITGSRVDPLTGDTRTVERNIAQSALIFTPNTNHLHLDLGNGGWTSPLQYVSHLDEDAPTIDYTSFKFNNNGTASLFSNNIIYGTQVIIETRILNTVEGDLDQTDVYIAPDEDNEYQRLVYWYYTGSEHVATNQSTGASTGATYYQINDVRRNNISTLSQIQNSTLEGIFPDYELTSNDNFKYYYNSRQKNNDRTQSAGCIEEADFKDRSYCFKTRTADITNNEELFLYDAIIDNFRPYVKKLEIWRDGKNQAEGGTLIYSRSWTWNGTSLSIGSAPTGPICDDDANLWIHVFTSEPMLNVELNAFGQTRNSTIPESESNEAEFVFQFNSSEISTGSQTIKITKNSKDIAGNKLQGFNSESSVTESQIPKRQNDGTWSPLATERDDIVHVIEIESGSLPAPDHLWASSQYSDKIEITWQASSEAKFFKISRRNQGSKLLFPTEWIDYTGLQFKYTDYDDGDLIPGDIYYYSVKAATNANGDGESPFSQEIAGSLYSECTVDFTYEQLSYEDPLDVEFSVITTIEIDEYHWNFGDDVTSDASNPTHTYSEPGNYTVTLNVMNSDGITCSRTYSVSVHERVIEDELDVSFDLAPIFGTIEDNYTMWGFVNNSPEATQPFTYEFNTGEEILKYEHVDWPDQRTESFTYSTLGKKYLSLLVTDATGKRGTYFDETEIFETVDDIDWCFFDQHGIGYQGCYITPVGGSITFSERALPASCMRAGDWYFKNTGTCDGTDDCFLSYNGYRPYVSYTYTTKGRFSVRHDLWANGDYKIGGTHQDWAGVTVVDCDVSVTTTNFSNAVYDDFGNIHRYYAGNFDLNNLNAVSDFNNKKVELTACNGIVLHPGFISAPTSGNSLKLIADNSCLAGGNLKSTPTVQESEEGSMNSGRRVSDFYSFTNENRVLIYPNPTKGTFNVEFTGGLENVVAIDIYSITGQKMESKMVGITEVNEFNTGNWFYGIYLVRITTNDGFIVKRLVKE
jgi:PKD repeat protein